MAENFSWKNGKPPPKLAPHSDRKLQVIEQYLDVYFDTVATNPRIDSLNITLVDAFCGGGLYDFGGETRLGSPLAVLERVRLAKIRLNQGRRKPLSIGASFHFSDERKAHVDHLGSVLASSDLGQEFSNDISLRVGKFEALLPSIVETIKAKQRSGRSIFILDQFGYSDVPMTSISYIFAHLPKAEIILTFSIDAMLNYLQPSKDPPPVAAQFGVDQRFLASWSEWKNDPNAGRGVAQRTIMAAMQKFSGAAFFTPFMLYSEHDNRWLMIAHLSQNQTARDKMLSVHWVKGNTFKHAGSGGQFEIGFDARAVDGNTLFSFSDIDNKVVLTELERDLPGRLRSLMSDGSLAVTDFLNLFGNKTAAMNQQILMC